MNRKAKLWIFVLFMVVVIGGGFLLATMIPRNAIKKTGYKTKTNPSYIDDKVREKQDSLKKLRK